MWCSVFEFLKFNWSTQVLQKGDKLTVLVKVHLNSDSGVFAQGLLSLQKCTWFKPSSTHVTPFIVHVHFLSFSSDCLLKTLYSLHTYTRISLKVLERMSWIYISCNGWFWDESGSDTFTDSPWCNFTVVVANISRGNNSFCCYVWWVQSSFPPLINSMLPVWVLGGDSIYARGRTHSHTHTHR